MPAPFQDEPDPSDHEPPTEGSAIGARVDPELQPEEPQSTPQPTSREPQGQQTSGSPASFWRRLGAYLVDSILLTLPTNLAIELALGRPMPTEIDFAAPAETLEILWPFAAVAFAVELVYFAGMEGSGLQATVGKYLLKIRVTDDQGEPVGFLRAGARNVSKLASAIPFGLGFLMIFTSRRNQALHDHIASCLVLEGRHDDAAGSPNLEGPQRGWDR